MRLMWRFWLTHPRDALCDLGIRGCELHIRTGWFTPFWKRGARE